MAFYFTDVSRNEKNGADFLRHFAAKKTQNDNPHVSRINLTFTVKRLSDILEHSCNDFQFAENCKHIRMQATPKIPNVRCSSNEKWIFIFAAISFLLLKHSFFFLSLQIALCQINEKPLHFKMNRAVMLTCLGYKMCDGNLSISI